MIAAIFFLGLEISVVLIYGPRTYTRRVWNILISIDQTANAYCGGDPDETLSSRTAKRSHKRGWYWLGRFLDRVDPGHLKRTREDDEGRSSAWD